MNILLLNGSTKENGNTACALREMQKVFASLGAEATVYTMRNAPLRDCIGCGGCRGKTRCVFSDDELNTFLEYADRADAFVFASPVYFAHPAGRILSLLDRAYYADRAAFTRKPGASLAVARRAGTTASCDVLNKYFTIAEMPLVSSSYWNVVFGSEPGEAALDPEGMQTVRNLAQNMVWLLRCIEAGRAQGITPPAGEHSAHTNFIR